MENNKTLSLIIQVIALVATTAGMVIYNKSASQPLPDWSVFVILGVVAVGVKSILSKLKI
jgi:hypothetical protein